MSNTARDVADDVLAERKKRVVAMVEGLRDTLCAGLEALEGREYSIRLTNRTSRRIAVALQVEWDHLPPRTVLLLPGLSIERVEQHQVTARLVVDQEECIARVRLHGGLGLPSVAGARDREQLAVRGHQRCRRANERKRN